MKLLLGAGKRACKYKLALFSFLVLPLPKYSTVPEKTSSLGSDEIGCGEKKGTGIIVSLSEQLSLEAGTWAHLYKSLVGIDAINL